MTATLPFMLYEYLEQPEDIVAYLAAAREAAIEDGDPRLIIMALSEIAQSKGLAEIDLHAGASGNLFELS